MNGRRQDSHHHGGELTTRLQMMHKRGDITQLHMQRKRSPQSARVVHDVDAADAEGCTGQDATSSRETVEVV